MPLAQVTAGTPTELSVGFPVTLSDGVQISYQSLMNQTEAARNAVSIYTIVPATVPSGKYMVSYTLNWTGSQVLQDGTFAPNPPIVAIPNQGVLFVLRAGDMNSTADQIFIRNAAMGSFTNYTIDQILIGEASTSLTNVIGGVYTAPSKGGVAVVAATQSFKSVTSATKAANAPLTTAGGDGRNSDLYLSLTTPQGSTATATIVVKGTIWS